jgi:hypothetical protein
MSKRNVVAFMAGLGSGYLRAKDNEDEKARRDKADARAQGLYDLTMDAERRRKADDEAVRVAGRDVVVNDNAATLGISGKPVVYEDAGVAGSDFRQARNMAERTGADPTAIAAPTPVYAANGIAFDNKPAAQAAANSANSPEAQNARIAQAYRATGRQGEALRMQASAKQLEAADLSIKQLKDAKARDDAFRDVVTKFKAGGWAAVPKIYEGYDDGNTATVVEDGKGGATIVAIGKDGKEVGRQTFASPMDFITGAVARLDPKLYVGMEEKRSEADRAQANADRAFDEGKRQFGINKGLQERQIGIQAANAKLAQESFNRQTLAGQLAQIETITGPLSPEDRKAYGMKLAGLGKDDESLAKFASTIAAEGVKAGTVDPKDAVMVRDKLIQSQLVARDEQVIATELAGKASDPAAYAASYAKAVKITPAARLKEMGFEPPAAAPMKMGAGRAAKAVAPNAAAAGIDPLAGRIIGKLTPMADIVASAQAGNAMAIKYLKDREQGVADSAVAPRTAAESLGVGY